MPIWDLLILASGAVLLVAALLQPRRSAVERTAWALFGVSMMVGAVGRLSALARFADPLAATSSVVSVTAGLLVAWVLLTGRSSPS